MKKKLIAVVSEYVDKRHGTERCIAEQIERLSEYYEFHVYSCSIKDIAGVKKYNKQDNASIYWHKIPKLPGPHLIKYIFWFIVNHFWRLWDYLINGIRYDIVYSPGINCIDADLIIVYHVFKEFYQSVKEGLRLREKPVYLWTLLFHRYLYYHLIIFLEHIIYFRKNLIFGAISKKVSKLLSDYYKKESFIVYPGIDFDKFSADLRLSLYNEEREKLGIKNSEFVILMVGNDWNVKGLPCLLKAMSLLKSLPLRLLVRGDDDKRIYEKKIKELHLNHEITFVKPIDDIFLLYVVSDLYASPSLYDSFAIPPLEAMSCGLPVIVSSKAGVSEIINDGLDGFILNDPMDYKMLASKIRLLYEDRSLRSEMGKLAANKARNYTWQKNVDIIKEIFDSIINKKH